MVFGQKRLISGDCVVAAHLLKSCSSWSYEVLNHQSVFDGLIVPESYRNRELSKREMPARSWIRLADLPDPPPACRRPSRICSALLQDRRLLLWTERVSFDRT